MARSTAKIWVGASWLVVAELLHGCVSVKDRRREAASTAEAAPSTPSAARPGPTADGGVLLPSGWSLRPAGRQLAVATLPETLAVHPDGRWLAVLNAGFGEHELDIVDLTTFQIASKVTMASSFYGLTFDRSGQTLYASGGEDGLVHAYKFAVATGQLVETPPLRVAPEAVRVKRGGTAPSSNSLVGGLAVDADLGIAYAALTFGDALIAAPLQGHQPARRLPLAAGDFPYALLLDPARSRLYISLWGHAGVAVYDTVQAKVVATWATASHPTELALAPDGKTLYVACANSTSVSVLDTATGRPRQTVTTALHPGFAVGSTPNSLALSPDGKLLLVANADQNNLAVFNVGDDVDRAVPLGFIPVGWYPTSVRWDPKGRQILVANGKGARSLPNPKGPTPLRRNDRAPDPQYIAALLMGTVSLIDFPEPEQMRAYTRQAFALSPVRRDLAPTLTPPPGSPVPAKVGGVSPLKHVIYIIKENRTYDQVFGDVKTGNGDPALCLFPDKITPNHHRLAREFVLLDNLYADGEVSADGHEWTTAAYATDFVEKMWPLNYRGSKTVGYPSEGTYDEIARSGCGYLWDRAASRGLDFINLGEWVTNGATADAPGTPSTPSLRGHIDPLYRGFDLATSDQKRADRFAVDLQEWAAKGAMPALVVMRLSSDHTEGTKPGAPTPIAFLADNDLALGRVVDAVSHSPFWKDTAIFVIEDDAQNGPDHVDAHRTVGLVVSPYTRRHVTDSTLYTTSSYLRTMELILGLEPMSPFDAAAQPLYASFQAQADLTPYTHVVPAVDLKAVNTAASWGAETSSRLAFETEDMNDDAVLNEIIWKSVKGQAAVMPAPVRAAFFVPSVVDDDDHHGDGDDGDDDDDD